MLPTLALGLTLAARGSLKRVTRIDDADAAQRHFVDRERVREVLAGYGLSE